jgi:N-acetyl-gamma-glutamyl-phosphate reductase
MLPTVYIDGQAGTTGLRIRDWLACRTDIRLVLIDDTGRKDDEVRRKAIGAADLVVLCLPDDAAVTAAGWAQESGTRVIDASTAHRVKPGWVYGLPELERGRRSEIREASRVANPGCYASAFALLIRPLLDAEILPPSASLSVHALSGYSGGGRALIERWEDPGRQLRSLPYEAPYALGNVHKHIPEMMQHTHLTVEPQFVPAVGPFRCGMRVEIPLHASLLSRGKDSSAVAECLEHRYRDEPFVRVAHIEDPRQLDERSFDPQAWNDTNRIELHVVPHPSGHTLLLGILDNLGKGASGVAIQNLNLMLGLEESEGLVC